MALKRFRVARHIGRYVVLDHGEPVGTTVIGPNQEGAGQTVPKYVSADADDPLTNTFVRWAAPDLSPESKAQAQAKADELNDQEG